MTMYNFIVASIEIIIIMVCLASQAPQARGRSVDAPCIPGHSTVPGDAPAGARSACIYKKTGQAPGECVPSGLRASGQASCRTAGNAAKGIRLGEGPRGPLLDGGGRA